MGKGITKGHEKGRGKYEYLLNISGHWWDAEKGQSHEQIFSDIRAIEDRQSGAQSSMCTHLGLYLDREINDFTTAFKSRATGLFGRSSNINLNVVKSCVDTVAAKIVSHRPKPMFTTIAGRFDDRQKAKKLEQWVDGLFYREGLYTQSAPHVFLDAAIFGTGALKVFQDDNDVCLEWCWIGELLFDDLSAMFAPPRVLFQRKYISRDCLKERYPKFAMEIDGLDEQSSSDLTTSVEDVVEVVEAWHLPSSKRAKDGKHVIAISTATLFEEPYRENDFPFVFFRWGRTPLGFYGIGLAEELHGIQTEIRHLLGRIQQAMKLTATAWLLKPRGTKISDEQFSNKIGSIIEYDGHVPPRVETPASMNSQVFDHLWELYRRAYEIAGVSQLSASSTKPAGVESGIALRTLADFETQRFALLSRDWEEFFLNVARKAVSTARRTFKGGGGKVKWADRNIVQEIEWKDVNLDDDAFVLRIYPVNLLPSTPSGKLATVQELMQMELLAPEEAKSLLDFPDLDKIQDLNSAAFEDLLSIFDSILYEGEWIAPQPEMYLEAGIRLANHYWCLGRKEGAPEQTLQMLIRWISEAKALITPPAPPQPPMPVGPEAPMPPEGAPPAGMEELPPNAMPPPEAMTASPADAAANVLAAGTPQALL